MPCVWLVLINSSPPRSQPSSDSLFTVLLNTLLSKSVLGFAVALLLGSAGVSLFAQPTGGHVLAGSAAIGSDAGGLVVTQSSARAIISWQDFSIAAGSVTRFVQPDATSATLNRVVSGLPSTLAGS